ncbi:MAG: hypothetical protein ACXW0Q_15025 [Methylovulum sp.]
MVFSNPHNIKADIVTLMAENVLIEKAYFVANKADVPDLHFEKYNEQLDHSWHEVHAFIPTEEAPNDPRGRNIEEFIESLRGA